MNQKLIVISSTRLIKALEKAGFEKVRQRQRFFGRLASLRMTLSKCSLSRESEHFGFKVLLKALSYLLK